MAWQTGPLSSKPPIDIFDSDPDRDSPNINRSEFQTPDQVSDHTLQPEVNCAESAASEDGGSESVCEKSHESDSGLCLSVNYDSTLDYNCLADTDLDSCLVTTGIGTPNTVSQPDCNSHVPAPSCNIIVDTETNSPSKISSTDAELFDSGNVEPCKTEAKLVCQDEANSLNVAEGSTDCSDGNTENTCTVTFGKKGQMKSQKDVKTNVANPVKQRSNKDKAQPHEIQYKNFCLTASHQKYSKITKKRGRKPKSSSTGSQCLISEAASIVVSKIGLFKKKVRKMKKAAKSNKSLKRLTQEKSCVTDCVAQEVIQLEYVSTGCIDDADLLSVESQLQQSQTDVTTLVETPELELGRKRASKDPIDEIVAEVKKKRGRPPKVATKPPHSLDDDVIAADAVPCDDQKFGLASVGEVLENIGCTGSTLEKTAQLIEGAKKKRGRPSKKKMPESSEVNTVKSSDSRLNNTKCDQNADTSVEIKSPGSQPAIKDKKPQTVLSNNEIEGENMKDKTLTGFQTEKTKRGTLRKKLGRPRKYEFYECRKCSYKAKERAHLKLHEKAHVREPYRCHYCDFTTRLNQHYLEHEAKHTNTKPFKCDKCSYQSRYKADLYHHKSKHATEKSHKCPYCDFVTKWRRNISHHVLTHTTDRPHKCDLCGFTFKRLQDLKYHLYRHSDQKPLTCDQCGFKCKTNFEMKCHKLKHSDVRYFKCTFPGCKQETKTKSDLTKHMKVHSSEKKFKCPLCGKCFKTYSCMSKHQQRHSDERPFLCDICQKSFKLKSSLRNHIRLHSGIKPHICEVCGKDFANKSNMKIHMKTHSEVDRPFRCPICIYGAKTAAHLLAHIGAMHGNSHAYFCELCKKPFKRYGQLQIHYKRMHCKQELEAIGNTGQFDIHAIKKELKIEIKGDYLAQEFNGSDGYGVTSVKNENSVEISVHEENPVARNHPLSSDEENNHILANPDEADSENKDMFKKETEADSSDEQQVSDQWSETTVTYDANNLDEIQLDDGPSLESVKPCNTATHPPATLALYDDFRLPIATKGFEFNFDKTGKKPKSWFMDPDNMVTEESAEKQRVYLAKQERLYNRENRQYYRKQRARLSKQYVHRNIRIIPINPKNNYRKTRLKMFSKKKISRSILSENQAHAPMKKGKLEVFSEKVIETVKPVVTNFGFMTKRKLQIAEINNVVKSELSQSKNKPISNSEFLQQPVTIPHDTITKVTAKKRGRPRKNRVEDASTEPNMDSNVNKNYESKRILDNKELCRDREIKNSKSAKPNCFPINVKKPKKVQSSKLAKYNTGKVKNVPLTSVVKKKRGRPPKSDIQSKDKKCIKVRLSIDGGNLSDSSDDVYLSVLAKKLTKKPLDKTKGRTNKCSNYQNKNISSWENSDGIATNSSLYNTQPKKWKKKMNRKCANSKKTDIKQKSTVLKSKCKMGKKSIKMSSKGMSMKSKQIEKNKMSKGVLEKQKMQKKGKKAMKKKMLKITIKLPKKKSETITSPMQTQVQVVRRRKRRKAIPEFETLRQIVDCSELAPQVLQPFVKLEPIEGIEYVSNGSVYVPLTGNGLVLPSVCATTGEICKLEISADMVINECAKVSMANTDAHERNSDEHVLYENADSDHNSQLAGHGHYFSDMVNTEDIPEAATDIPAASAGQLLMKQGTYDQHKEAWKTESRSPNDAHSADFSQTNLPLDLTSPPQQMIIHKPVITNEDHNNPLDLSLSPHIDHVMQSSDLSRIEEGPLDLSKSSSPLAVVNSQVADFGCVATIKTEPVDNEYIR